MGAKRLFPLPFHSLRDWHKSDKPSRPEAATTRQDATSQLANTNHPKFQFTLNQDS